MVPDICVLDMELSFIHVTQGLYQLGYSLRPHLGLERLIFESTKATFYCPHIPRPGDLLIPVGLLPLFENLDYPEQSQVQP